MHTLAIIMNLKRFEKIIILGKMVIIAVMINLNTESNVPIWLFIQRRTYMVKSHEDAYRPDNLSLFSVSCEHYREPKNKIMGKTGLYGLSACRVSAVE